MRISWCDDLPAGVCWAEALLELDPALLPCLPFELAHVDKEGAEVDGEDNRLENGWSSDNALASRLVNTCT